MGVFNSPEGKPFVVRAGKAIVTIGNSQLLALGVTIEYQRAVESVPVISDMRVLSIGEAQGRFTAETLIVGDAGDLLYDEMHIFEDGCKPFDMTISLDESCDMGSASIDLINCVASAVSLSMQGGRGYVATGVTATFTAMDM